MLAQFFQVVICDLSQPQIPRFVAFKALLNMARPLLFVFIVASIPPPPTDISKTYMKGALLSSFPPTLLFYCLRHFDLFSGAVALKHSI